MNTPLLEGIVGSTAYGLAGPHSDVDRLGVFAAPTRAFHGLYPPIDGRAKQIVRVIVIILGVLSLLRYLAVF